MATFDIQTLMDLQKAQMEKIQGMRGPGMTMAPMMEMMKMQAAAAEQISALLEDASLPYGEALS